MKNIYSNIYSFNKKTLRKTIKLLNQGNLVGLPTETVYGLAGVGDLYVSAVGGRNSKMGEYLGKGYTFKRAKKKFMPNDTVEGEQLAKEIAPFVFKRIDKKKIPLMINLLRTIISNKKLKIKV